MRTAIYVLVFGLLVAMGPGCKTGSSQGEGGFVGAAESCKRSCSEGSTGVYREALYMCHQPDDPSKPLECFASMASCTCVTAQ